MKKSVIAGIMLAACTGANAQNVQDPVASFKNRDVYSILPEFTIDNKTKFMVWVYAEDEGTSTIANVYNDDIEQIATVNTESEYVTTRVVREREAVNVDGEIKFTGQWTEHKEGFTESAHKILIDDMNNSVDGESIYLTQTLFNNDEDYEFIVPEITSTSAIEKEDRDGDGEIDYEVTEYNYIYSGFKIKSGNGQTLQTIKLDNGYSMDFIYLLRINEKSYLMVSTSYYDGNSYDEQVLFYPIKSNTSGVNPLGAPTTVKVAPRIANRSESFTVEIDGENNTPRIVEVANMAGQIVWKQKVAAGQNTLSISADRLSKGVNIIRVNGKQTETCKVIVK